MSVAEFSATIKSQVYKNWLNQLKRNLVTTTVKELRKGEQIAAKTDFYLSVAQVQDMYKTVTGNSLDSVEANFFIRELAKPSNTVDKTKAVQGTLIKAGNSSAVKFESIGFDTISTRLVNLFDQYPEVQDAYREAEETYIANERIALDRTSTLRGRAKQVLIDDIEKEGKRRGSFGYYFNKGHVVSLATNLSKNFRDEIAKADVLSKQQRDLLVSVLDQYIDKLQKEDLATANLPNAVNQELYAGYIKSSDKYLVEIQHRVSNEESGRLSIAQVEELRRIFSLSDNDTENIMRSSPSLGKKLVETEGSPSFIDIIMKDISNILNNVSAKKVVYRQPLKLVASKSTKIVKTNNKANISKAKELRAKIKAVRSDPTKIKYVDQSPTNLLAILQAGINKQVAKNMGQGNEHRVLNYRTGRFAESVQVQRLSESRQGMITAFYSYMRNPYGTFSEGGRQQFPKSRDPKLLISKSVRELAAPIVGARMRAVLV